MRAKEKRPGIAGPDVSPTSHPDSDRSEGYTGGSTLTRLLDELEDDHLERQLLVALYDDGSSRLSVTAICPCGAPIEGMRADARYCSNACRQRAYRERGAS